jgi:hypothetical protein
VLAFLQRRARGDIDVAGEGTIVLEDREAGVPVKMI